MKGVQTVALLWLPTALGVHPAAAQERFTLRHVEALVGCWQGTTGELEVWEQWSGDEGGVMLGATRFIRDGEVVDWEFGRIVAGGGAVTLWPYPRGTISERGFPLVRVDEEIVFENLAHDFPVRIVYAPDGPNRLHPRIEGRDGDGPAWPLRRVACAGG